jgi:hypothetical protein
MAYTPELSYENSCNLRRIAWSFNKPMTQTLEIVVEEYAKAKEAELICKCCKDKTRCDACIFNGKNVRSISTPQSPDDP